MNMSLLMITLITKKVSIDGLWGGNKSCLKTFRGRNFRQRRAKSVHGKMALPCILNKKLLLLAVSSKSILYFKLYATELLKPFRQDTK